MADQKETGYILTVKDSKDGDEYFKIGAKSIKGFKFIMNSPDDVETKEDNIMAELYIKGEFNNNTDDDIPKKIVDWCLTNTDTGEAFKYLQFDYIVGDLVKRRYIFPNAFVVDFQEEQGFDEKNSKGFYLFVKQNKDDLTDFSMETAVAKE